MNQNTYPRGTIDNVLVDHLTIGGVAQTIDGLAVMRGDEHPFTFTAPLTVDTKPAILLDTTDLSEGTYTVWADVNPVGSERRLIRVGQIVID